MNLVTDQPLDAKVNADVANETIALAAKLLKQAAAQQTAEEKRQAAKLARLMHDPVGKQFTMAMSDQAFRSHDTERVANQLAHLLRKFGVPEYLEPIERILLGIGTQASQFLPEFVVPKIIEKLRQETENVILPAEDKPLNKYLKTRYSTGTRLNLNYLGEAILGEEEAQRRFEAYVEMLRRPDVEYISVKISSIYSQINLVAFEATVDALQNRLRKLYETALENTFVHPDGRKTPKFVNLDMEEYRDLHLTVAAFKRTLEEPAFKQLRAGIVLQAYLPDSHPIQRDLTEWAMQRVANGGAPIKMRIVKGANLAMERVEAALHDWEQAPYYYKTDVDANYKRMVTFGCQPEHAKAVNLGIASHNLFDVAYGLIMRERNQVQAHVEFEMLEGMANHQARAVQAEADGLLLYAPVVKRDDFHSAIAYLVRRLDENTAPENFLHDLFGMTEGSPEWERQKTRFLTSLELKSVAPQGPNRIQNRNGAPKLFNPAGPFHNASDTDFSLPANVDWINAVIAKWQNKAIDPIGLQIAGGEHYPNQDGVGRDPSLPGKVAYNYALADETLVEAAIDAAKSAQAEWSNTSVQERRTLLISVAEEIAKQHGDLMGAMMLDGGKTVLQADIEVSEAIDFANYYARSLDALASETQDLTGKPLGTVVVTPPWNFPFAIPCGGVLSALMAGNTVILKPALETVLVGWKLANVLWDAGIPKSALQFVVAPDNHIGQMLITDPRVDAVILTGGSETAQLFQGWRPDLNLFAETSGKNALIITSMADHDLAIKDLVASAFGHSGQKCSAASLAILEAEVYDNPIFMRQLRDAAASLTVGSAWDTTSMIGPIIREASPELERGLCQLDAGETWLLEPKQDSDNPNLWSPGIRLGVTPDSWYRNTECFGPVLGLVRADNLAHAIQIANDSEFGLTGGIHTLDEREVEIWRDKVEVGNAYINRGITGAIVQRQPFGGWKRSAIGSGAKAGGPNYVASLMNWEQSGLPLQRATPKISDELMQACLRNCDNPTVIRAAAENYSHAIETHYSQVVDPSKVLGESNIFRYLPLKTVHIRVTESNLDAIALTLIAASTSNVSVNLSVAPTIDCEWTRKFVDSYHVESDADFATRLQALNNIQTRLRVIGALPLDVRQTANNAYLPVIDRAVLANGRMELHWLYREQAMSETTHRYGNLQ